MPKRVFVSSTFFDLRDHREAVRKVIKRLGADDVAMERGLWPWGGVGGLPTSLALTPFV